ncbi:MAG: DUF4861 domain-containing protein [Bacteroidaceae bacterium]
MKNIIYLALIAMIVSACSQVKTINVTVENLSSLERIGEIVEVPMVEVVEKLHLADTAQVIVLDENGQQVPYQITYDEKLVFPSTVKANGQAIYTIAVGTPIAFDTKTTGKQYPERVDDVAWENDRIAFRTYGPALQASGEKAYGYDIWVKNTEEPVVETRYEMELNSDVLAEIERMKKIDADSAKSLRQLTSYHVDHGNGLDCYKVGPTLGGGAAALMVGDTIVYQNCYLTQEILDNGPLRFTVKLTYNPLTIRGNTEVVETRVITLDQGSQLNKTVVNYSHLNEPLSVVTGIVLHEENGGQNVAEATKGYIAYADPTDNVDNNNGIIYVGAVFPANVKEAKVNLFSAKEKALRGGADGHVMAISEYAPNSDYTYYWGAGWSKWGFNSFEAWTKYLDEYSQKVRTPLNVTLQ